MQWLRRNLIAGFFVTVPLVISVAALVWIFQVVDGLLRPAFAGWLGYDIPGLGLVATALMLLVVGVLATNVIGRRVLRRAEHYLLKVPVFRTIYAPVRQLVLAFSPDNELGFKRVAFVEDQAQHRFVLGFVTREFAVDRGQGPETMVAVYVPTNHLYLGDIYIYPRSVVRFPDISVEEGIRIFLTGGMSLPTHVRARRQDDRLRETGS